MTLTRGDHLVIKRGDQILGPEDEAYHEFKVITDPIPQALPRDAGEEAVAYMAVLEVIA